jgi:DNA/RNA endonuclease G (NUC1)
LTRGHRARAAASRGKADVAALDGHLMTNTAPTGATYDIDGGQQFVGA